ncbi:hypothetical protein, partial [Oenococcus oeni]|uniref:hypothetical protein n=1 Tax=Oenococcus oeni TaxID=1247 RepID=UPI00214CBC3B
MITLIIFFFASQAARIVMKAARATIKKLGLMIWANRHIKNRSTKLKKRQLFDLKSAFCHFR